MLKSQDKKNFKKNPQIFWRKNNFNRIFAPSIAGIAQLVELQPSKLNVAGSSPVSRSKN